ncbi:hypothetical protein NPX13_g2350 [Xylaria arbuscula]|uniref:Oxidoreductase N-terminal domain-containing protein n=1 Tax=Xylaria arbuscula TaxID=114810 RepID=A0A9W8NK82_9PEZI|nr:hypothetical protein NPX13_g2350 [Xylaria arbuscula]
MARENKRFVLAKRPERDFIPGETFRLEKGPAPTADDLKDGQVLVEALYLSLDPGTRAWLKHSPDSVVQMGSTMWGFTVSRVLASKNPLVKEGDIVSATSGWAEVAVVEEPNFSKAEIPKGGEITDLIGVLGACFLSLDLWLITLLSMKRKTDRTDFSSSQQGVTGVTAYLGLDKIGKPQAGETSSCPPPPAQPGRPRRSYVSQIDLFWDNVGGEILDAALPLAKQFARFVICGAISTYNNPEDAKGVYNLAYVNLKSIRMEGFTCFNYIQEWPEARRVLGEWLAEGKLKRKDTIVRGGIEKAEYAFRDLFEGKNRGKLIVEIKSPE